MLCIPLLCAFAFVLSLLFVTFRVCCLHFLLHHHTDWLLLFCWVTQYRFFLFYRSLLPRRLQFPFDTVYTFVNTFPAHFHALRLQTLCIYGVAARADGSRRDGSGTSTFVPADSDLPRAISTAVVASTTRLFSISIAPPCVLRGGTAFTFLFPATVPPA